MQVGLSQGGYAPDDEQCAHGREFRTDLHFPPFFLFFLSTPREKKYVPVRAPAGHDGDARRGAARAPIRAAVRAVPRGAHRDDARGGARGGAPVRRAVLRRVDAAHHLQKVQRGARAAGALLGVRVGRAPARPRTDLWGCDARRFCGPTKAKKSWDLREKKRMSKRLRHQELAQGVLGAVGGVAPLRPTRQDTLASVRAAFENIKQLPWPEMGDALNEIETMIKDDLDPEYIKKRKLDSITLETGHKITAHTQKFMHDCGFTLHIPPTTMQGLRGATQHYELKKNDEIKLEGDISMLALAANDMVLDKEIYTWLRSNCLEGAAARASLL